MIALKRFKLIKFSYLGVQNFILVLVHVTWKIENKPTFYNFATKIKNTFLAKYKLINCQKTIMTLSSSLTQKVNYAYVNPHAKYNT